MAHLAWVLSLIEFNHVLLDSEVSYIQSVNSNPFYELARVERKGERKRCELTDW